jgi:class 3 adenylate cyclase
MPERGRGGERLPTTILFTDIVDSTIRAGELGDERWRQILRSHHATIRRELKHYGGHEVDNAGDGFFAAFSSPAAAIRCACAIVDAVRPLGIEVRAGVHVGESVRVGDKPGGMAVHIGSRIAGNAGPSEVAVSGTVRDLTTGSGIAFEDRGMTSLKGVEGEWRIYAVARKGDLVPRELVPERPPTDRPPRRNRWVALAVALATIAAAVGAFVVFRDTGEPGPTASPPGPTAATYTNGLFRIDPETMEVTSANDQVRIPLAMVRADESLWAASLEQVAKYNPETNTYVARLDIERNFAVIDMVVADGSLWVLDHVLGVDDILYEVDLRTNEFVREVGLGLATEGLVVRQGEFWVASSEGDLLRLDPRSGQILGRVRFGGNPGELATDGDSLFVLDPIEGAVYRADPSSERVERVGVEGALGIAVGAGRLWVTTDKGLLLGLNLRSLVAETTVPLDDTRAFEVAVGPTAVWIGTRNGKVMRIDLDQDDRVAATLDLGGRVQYITITPERSDVWLGVGNFG